MSSFTFPRIIAGIFVGPHGAVRNVFLICCGLLIASVGISTWSRSISNVQHHPRGPSSGQRKSAEGRDTSSGNEDNDASGDRDITAQNRDNNTSDESAPPPAEYLIQILHESPKAAVEYVFAPKWS